MPFIFLALLLLPTLYIENAAAQLSAHLDRAEIYVHETVTLTVISNNTSGSSNLDLSTLQNDFRVLGQSSSSSTSIVNGQMTSTRQWHFQIKPKQSGRLTVPAFIHGQERSQPIKLNVLPATRVQAPTQSPPQTSMSGTHTHGGQTGQDKTLSTQSADKQKHEDVSIDIKVSAASVYVQQELILTIRLYYSVNLYEAALSDFEVRDTVMENLGNKRDYKTKIDGKVVHVSEQQIAIYPLSPGKITIPTLSLTAIIPNPNGHRSQRQSAFDQMLGSRFSLNSSSRMKVQRHFPEFDIEVKPIPAQYPKNSAWIPAREVKLQQSWQPTSPEFKVGEPVTRVLTLHADGQHQSFLPDIPKPDIAGVKIYSDQAELEQQAGKQGIVSQRTESHAILAAAPGNITLPETSLYWWNTKTDRLEVATLGHERFNVAAGEHYAQQSNLAHPNVAQAPSSLTNSGLNEQLHLDGGQMGGLNGGNGDASLSASPIQTTQTLPHWAVAIIGLLLILLAAAIVIIFILLRKRSGSDRSTGGEVTATKSLTKATRKMLMTCKTESAVIVKDALLQWGRLAAGRNDIYSLEALARALDSEKFSRAIEPLNRVLYAGDEGKRGGDGGDWNREALVEAIRDYRSGGSQGSGEGRSADGDTVLKQLYP